LAPANGGLIRSPAALLTIPIALSNIFFLQKLKINQTKSFH
jgi:hypothetical protein